VNPFLEGDLVDEEEIADEAYVPLRRGGPNKLVIALVALIVVGAIAVVVYLLQSTVESDSVEVVEVMTLPDDEVQNDEIQVETETDAETETAVEAAIAEAVVEGDVDAAITDQVEAATMAATAKVDESMTEADAVADLETDEAIAAEIEGLESVEATVEAEEVVSELADEVSPTVEVSPVEIEESVEPPSASQEELKRESMIRIDSSGEVLKFSSAKE
jgi:hypothetical protein